MNGIIGVQTVIFFYHFMGSFTGSVMAPAGRACQVPENIPGLPGPVYFPRHISPFFKRDYKGIVGLNIPRKAIDRTFLFLFKSAKYPVPDDQDACMIFIKVFQITAMMYTVVGGGI